MIFQLKTGNPNHDLTSSDSVAYVESGALMVKLTDGLRNVGIEPGGELKVTVNETYTTFGSQFAADQVNRLFVSGLTGSHIDVSNAYVSSDNNTSDVLMSVNSGMAAPFHYVHVEGTNKASTTIDRLLHVSCPIGSSIWISCGSGTFIGVNYKYYGG